MTLIQPKMQELTAKMKAAYSKKNARGERRGRPARVHAGCSSHWCADSKASLRFRAAGMEEAEAYRLELQTLMAKHNVSPFTAMASAVVSLPVWVSSLR